MTNQHTAKTAPTLTFVPAGGMGNRMKAVSAAITLAQQCHSRVEIIWFRDGGLGCRFDQLFLPLHEPEVTLREATLTDLLLHDRPRRRNLYVPLCAQRLIYEGRMDEQACTQGMRTHFDFVEWATGKRAWMSSHVYFMADEPPTGTYDRFRLVPRLQQRVEHTVAEAGANVVGVHIRRTDNERSIAESPTEAFIARMRQEPEDTRFFLATDNEEEKLRIAAAFPHRVITSPRPADRRTLQGMEDAAVEMFTLSRTRLILGSACSTFSSAAAGIGHIPLEIVKKTAI